MRVYCTKYALTEGILLVEGDIWFNRGGYAVDFFAGNTVSKKAFPVFLHRIHWHETYESARVRAAKMRDERIASLRKQIKKLERLSFAEAEPSFHGDGNVD